MNAKKFFLGIMSFAAICGIETAQAQVGSEVTPVNEAVEAPKPKRKSNKADAVLFKIHDISQINQNDGMYRACDFYVTFYNRSDKDINGATLNLTWTDDALEEIINNERKASEEEMMKQDQMSEQNMVQDDEVPVPSYTEHVSPQEIMTTIDMPAVKAYSQISVRSRIQTDRCFVLLNDVKTKITSCLANDTSAVTAVGADKGCSGLFQFVSAKSPEYYIEFKPISYNEQQTKAKKKKAEETKAIETDYHKSLEMLEKASRTLAEIK